MMLSPGSSLDGETRVFSIVTLLTPDGAYGGPATVALHQARHMNERGASTMVIAGGRGFDEPPKHLSGVSVQLFRVRRVAPGRKFWGLSAPAMIPWIVRNRTGAEVMHLHLARDLIMLPAAMVVRALRMPYVVQAHGAVQPKTSKIARLLDLLITRPILRGADAVLCLTERERAAVLQLEPRSRTRLLPNSTEVAGELKASASAVAHRSRGVAEESLDVLFLARLHPVKRPEAFATSAIALAPKFRRARFAIAGPDEGSRAGVMELLKEAGLPDNISLEGPVPRNDVASRMRRCDIFVQPSESESFGLSVLEAMAQGRPVIVTDGCALADDIRDAKAGIVVDQSVDSLTAAIEYLLSNPLDRAQMGARGAELVRTRFSPDVVAGMLDTVYQEVRARYTTSETSRKGRA